MNKLILVGLAFTLVQCTSKHKTTSTQAETTQKVDTDLTASSSSNIIGTKNFHFYSIASLDESSILQMGDYKGKKILVVNVASKCGYTPQYEGLQKLHEQYGEQVQIIGFPCNQFMGQEPGGKEEIATFCKKNYGVTFPLSTKINVKGDSQNEIYKWLTSKSLNQKDDYKVSWNFNKFLIDENGNLLGHYSSKVKPMSEELISAILDK